MRNLGASAMVLVAVLLTTGLACNGPRLTHTATTAHTPIVLAATPVSAGTSIPSPEPSTPVLLGHIHNGKVYRRCRRRHIKAGMTCGVHARRQLEESL